MYDGRVQAGFEIASLVKKVDDKITTVFEGLFPSTRQVECLSNRNIDFVVRGEPEYTILELVNVLEKGNSGNLEKVRGISYVKDGEVIDNPLRPGIDNLDLLPFPARRLLPMDAYFEASTESPLGMGRLHKRYTPMLTSRGCPQACIFCFYHILMDRKWIDNRCSFSVRPQLGYKFTISEERQHFGDRLSSSFLFFLEYFSFL